MFTKIRRDIECCGAEVAGSCVLLYGFWTQYSGTTSSTPSVGFLFLSDDFEKSSPIVLIKTSSIMSGGVHVLILDIQGNCS